MELKTPQELQRKLRAYLYLLKGESSKNPPPPNYQPAFQYIGHEPTELGYYFKISKEDISWLSEMIADETNLIATEIGRSLEKAAQERGTDLNSEPLYFNFWAEGVQNL